MYSTIVANITKINGHYVGYSTEYWISCFMSDIAPSVQENVIVGLPLHNQKRCLYKFTFSSQYLYQKVQYEPVHHPYHK
jgi:hypothetical protein